MRIIKKLFLIVSIMIAVSNTADAASFIKMDNISSFSQMPIEDGVSGDITEKLFSLNGKKMRLKPKLNFSAYTIAGGCVEILDAVSGERYASFPVAKWPYFRAKKLIADTGEEFVFVQAGRRAVSDSACDGIWLFGLHKGSYVIFVTIDTINKAGLLYEDISSNIEDGELKLLGYARDRSCVNGKFKGHSAYPIGVADYGINSTYLFWDENAQWFGIRKAD